MALYEKKWWQKFVGKKKPVRKVDVLNDTEAIVEFLKDLDTKRLLKQVQKLEELEREYKVAKSGVIQVNLESQAKILDNILTEYESLQNDVDINGMRVKLIKNEFLKKAEKAGLKDLVKEKRKALHWQGKW